MTEMMELNSAPGGDQACEAVAVVEDSVLSAMVEKLVKMGEQINQVDKHLLTVVVQYEKFDGVTAQLAAVEVGNKDLAKMIWAWKNSLEKDIKALEKDIGALGEKNNLGPVVADLIGIKNGMNQDITRLQEAMKGHMEYFEQPRVKQVEMRYIVDWASYLFVGLFLALVAFILLWGQASSDARRSRENDVKWRGVSVMKTPGLFWVLDSVQRMYSANPDQFQKDVESEEQTEKELQERLLQERSNRQRIEELQRK